MTINRLTSTVFIKYRPEESWFIPIKFIQDGTTNPFDFSSYDLELSVWNKATEQFAIINATATTQSKIICSRIYQSGSPQENGIQLEDEQGSLFTIFYDVARDIVLPFGILEGLIAPIPREALIPFFL
jgi:hypothetical protein